MRHRSLLFIAKMLPYYKLVRTLTFPSLARILVFLFTVTLLGCMLGFTLAYSKLQAVVDGLFFGLLVFFLPAIIVDFLSSRLLLKDDLLFYLRRCLALSLFSCIIWTMILFLGGIFHGFIIPLDFPQQPFYLALFTVLPLRSLAVFSMSSKNVLNKILFIFLEPSASVIMAVLLFNLNLHLLTVVFSISSLLSLIPLLVLLRYVELKGKKVVKASPLRVFRAFLLDWLNRKNEMFEEFLEEIGTYDKINLTLIQFISKRLRKPKGLFVISNFHPGPFLNVGSSILPYLIQKSFEEKGDIVVAVPHGVSGHEHNLVSQCQNEKVISAIKSLAIDLSPIGGISPFERFEVGSAKVGAQIFGDCLLLTLTQSPKDMEDIPFQLGSDISEAAKSKFNHVAVIDAHNCISDVRNFTEQEIADLRSAALQAINSCNYSDAANLEMGVAKNVLQGCGPEHGTGPGGISTFLFKVSDQLTAYVIVDANNMAPGLREKMLSSLDSLGIKGGEVMTTDTHIVNGLVPAKLGYYPLGEAIDQTVIVDHLIKTVEEARNNLEEITVASASSTVEVKSLGSESLETLTYFMYGIAKLVAAYMLMMFLTANFIGLTLLG